jgi:hypothetical protein
MQGKYFNTTLVPLFVTSLLFGCAAAETYHLYSGNPRPLSEIATLKPWHDTRFMPIGSLDVWPVSIDGQITEAYSGALPSYYLLPGEHKIVIGFIWTEGSNRVAGEDPEEMLFTAEVGHLYLTKAYMPKKMAEGQVRVSFWIEDANTGEVVAGTRPVTKK